MVPPTVAVVDGANGYVASNTICEMVKRGVRVKALARGARTRVPQALAMATVNEGELPPPGVEKVETYECELTRENLGIDDAVAAEIFAEPCDFWHFAAAVDLSPNRPALLAEVNTRGTERALRLFAEHARPGSRFFLISTAYVGGVSDTPTREDWLPITADCRFRTVYEETKRGGELIFRDYLTEHGIDGAVFRLGQVVGSSKTAHTTSDFGIYNFMKGMRRVAARFPGGSAAVQVGESATLNLVPIDICVDWLLALAEVEKPPRIVNLTDRVGVSAAETVRTIGAGLGMTLRPVHTRDWADSRLSTLDRAVAARLAYTGKYLVDTIEFERRNLESTLTVPDAVCDLDLVERLVDWYLK
ncbi:SDR family oxidoreductase [Nocardia pseudobrasiliensis]|uniref:Nucleoside-diphosphate-sugar epimerase n=1 Tax=Nocardia pseudobrasiliensis TaxID=45979 RepID=A0A370I497_9NOCA|nr:SDR family oxidoreductase [Nocardia pseudobrasiliensis]RDI65548.1 nucleoside-diphosphate-sugar epimerase [Nocardia pseudobrasiliensis]